MTMERNAKARHSAELERARQEGYTERTFASPKLVRAARADRGHSRMTGAEYREHAMHRGQAGQPAAAIREANATTKIRALRSLRRK